VDFRCVGDDCARAFFIIVETFHLHHGDIRFVFFFSVCGVCKI
jgi:hypothetical protein